MFTYCVNNTIERRYYMKITNIMMLMAFLANVAVLSGCGKKTCTASEADLKAVCEAKPIGNCGEIYGCTGATGSSSCTYNHNKAVEEAKTKCASLAEDKCTYKQGSIEVCKLQ